MGKPVGTGWKLEIVRGREAGRVYPLGPGSTVLGNSLGGEPGIDLAGQEGSAPRRMAGRQAAIECSPAGVVVRDLDSPGGTFVNRQRILPGQARRLADGDVIQVASVQLRVVENGARREPAAPVATPPPRPPDPPPPVAATKAGPLPAPFVLADGTACRAWDDFLTVSARSWSSLRDELTSGRLSAFLRLVGRESLEPASRPDDSADDRLDAWLGRLPTTRPARPDIEVHPATVRVKAVAGGGLTRARLVVTNIGYRLLRSTVRVEPAGTTWVRLSSHLQGAPFSTAETTEVVLEVEIPESLAAPRSCVVVVESNGGSRRVEVRVEPSAPAAFPTQEATGAGGATFGLRDVVAGLSPRVRLVSACVLGLLLRVAAAVGDRVHWLEGPAGSDRPALGGPAVMLAVAGSACAAVLAARRGGVRDAPAAAFAGGVAGVLAASLGVAACRSIEPVFGGASPLSTAPAAVLWAGVGAVVALGSLLVIPHQAGEGGAP